MNFGAFHFIHKYYSGGEYAPLFFTTSLGTTDGFSSKGFTLASETKNGAQVQGVKINLKNQRLGFIHKQKYILGMFCFLPLLVCGLVCARTLPWQPW